MTATRTRRKFLKGAALGAVACTAHLAAAPTQAMPIKLPGPATVPTVQILVGNDQKQLVGTGSGTFVGNERLVLTNFHVVGDRRTDKLYHRNGSVTIAVTTNPRLAAQPRYIAQVLIAASSAPIDIALLRIVANLDGTPITGCIHEPTATLGDSDALQLGDQLKMYGYPGVGGATLTSTSGEVSGFDQTGMIKTDAEIGPSSSGGSTYNQAGELVGIPSAGRSDPISGARLGLVIPINIVKPRLEQASAMVAQRCGLTLEDFKKIEQRHKIALNDSFQTRRNWPESNDAWGSKQLVDNVYAFTAKQPHMMLTETWKEALGSSYIIQLEVNFPQPGPGYTAGIVFDATSRKLEEFVTFRISSNGWWGYDTYTRTGWKQQLSLPWQNVNHLVVPNGTNMLWIVRTPTEVQFWLNATHIGILNRPAALQSYIGMVAHSHEIATPVRIQFDNLRVHVPR
jgi:S1-C subfamily serine protease